jgi:hypothetical protein
MIDSILFLARTEQPKASIMRESVDLQALAGACLALRDARHFAHHQQRTQQRTQQRVACGECA